MLGRLDYLTIFFKYYDIRILYTYIVNISS